MASAAEHEDGPGGGLPGAPAGIPVDLTLVKQEAEDWWEVGGGPWPEPAAEDGRAGAARPKPEVAGGWRVKAEQVEVKVENVKVEEETADWPEVKEEQEEQGEEEEPGWQLKHELGVGRSAKEEPGVDAAPVEREHWLRTDLKDDVRVKDEPAATPAVGCKRKLAMSRCETCGTKEAKYRCPRCMRYSCSLPCVKKHKAELTCNGVRDKTAYISIQHFTEMNLLSDYRFLEDVARTADHISRDTFLKRPTSSKRMCFMKNRARRQGINLRLLPNGFTKRKENSTFFDKRKQQFCWHVKLQFPQSQAEYIEKRVPEDKTINEILKSYIDPEKSDPVIRQRLKAYIRSQTGVQILMKVENMQQNLLRYHELDPYQSLLDNLRNKVIIEYPTLLIVLKGSSNNLKILHQVKSESATHLDNEN